MIKKFKKPAAKEPDVPPKPERKGLATIYKHRADVSTHASIKPISRRYPQRVKMYCLIKYLAINPATAKAKYTMTQIADMCNKKFGTFLDMQKVCQWKWRLGWKPIRDKLFSDATYLAMRPMERVAKRRTIVHAKMAEGTFFEPMDALDVLNSPYYDKVMVSTTVMKRAVEQNKLAHKAIKFAAKKGMLESSKECSERLAISAGEASSIFQSSAKTMKEFIGVVGAPESSTVINNNVTNVTANQHQQLVAGGNINLSTLNYELIMQLFGNQQMAEKHPDKIKKIGGEGEVMLIAPNNDEFLFSTERDKT